MIFKTAYDTTMGKIINTEPIAHAIEIGVVKESVDQITLGVKPRNFYKSFFLTGLYDSEQQIPLFTHPLLIERKDSYYLVSDARLFINPMGADKSNIGNFAKNKVEFNFAKARNILTLAWVSGDMGQIKNGLRFAREVYASFIAQTISRAYYLDPGDQQKIQILANYFYDMLFVDAVVAPQEMQQGWVGHTIENTKSTSAQVDAIFAQIKNMSNLEQFCGTVVEVCQNTRLHDFNHLSLLTLIRNTWFGVNAKEIIAVAVEHPPTWAAMIYTALQERTFKNSALTKTAEAMNKRGSGGEFIRSFEDIVVQYLDRDKMALESMEIPYEPSVGEQVLPFSE